MVRPNFIVINTDDQRWNTLRFMPTVMAELVERGVTFENSFVTTSLCCPSRASLLTGQYAHHHGVVTLGGADRIDDSQTLAVWLHDAGYRTGIFGKYMNDTAKLPPEEIPPGWDRWVSFYDDRGSYAREFFYYDYTLNRDGSLERRGRETEDYSTDLLARDAVEFIREADDRPFFLLFTPFAPHAPSVAAARHEGFFSDYVFERRPNYQEQDVSDKHPALHTAQRRALSRGETGKREMDELMDRLRRKALATLLSVDEALAALLRALDEKGEAENTVVVFTSDNGEMWGEHFAVGKTLAYEESIRVPLIIRAPRLVPEKRVDSNLVLNIDIAPTLLALAGVPIPEMVDGASLAPVLLDPSAPPVRDAFLIEFWNLLRKPVGMPSYSAVRTHDWKYIEVEEKGEVPAFEELYDLRSDPYELDNRLFSTPEDPTIQSQRKQLAKQLDALRGPPIGKRRKSNRSIDPQSR